jgi:DNA (cytosine-5)-methyltransferase 1
MGYHRAGFDVVGVDIKPQPRYPFEFEQAEALSWLRLSSLLNGVPFDAIHASPPCQAYSKAMRHLSAPTERLIEETRALLAATGLPWIMENVEGAPLPRASTLTGEHGVELCGTMFGLRVWRHRLFETSFPITPPRGCDHRDPAMNPHNQRGRDRITAEFGEGDQERPWRADMGVEWMGRYEAREAIPPAYTEWLGARLLEHVCQDAAA